MAMAKWRARVILNWMNDYQGLNLRGQPYNPAGWVALKLSCSQASAEQKIDQAARVLGAEWHVKPQVAQPAGL